MQSSPSMTSSCEPALRSRSWSFVDAPLTLVGQGGKASWIAAGRLLRAWKLPGTSSRGRWASGSHTLQCTCAARDEHAEGASCPARSGSAATTACRQRVHTQTAARRRNRRSPHGGEGRSRTSLPLRGSKSGQISQVSPSKLALKWQRRTRSESSCL